MESRSVRPGHSSIPRIAWLLLAAAATSFAVFVVRDWYQLFGPYLIVRPQLVIEAVATAAPFLVAAGVLAGRGRWPAGSRWLTWGAGAYALNGVLQVLWSAWLAWWEASPSLVASPMDGLLAARAWLSLLSAIAAPALLAAGLWAASRRRPSTGRERVASALIAGIAVAALAGSALLAVTEMAREAGSGMVPFESIIGAVFSVGLALSAAAMALLALAAVRAIPRRGPLPELAVAGGATLAAVGPPWMSWAQVVLPQATLAEHSGWAFTVPGAVVAAGMLLLAGGFALGFVAPRPSEPA